MATEIQEPNDIPPNSITDENANQFEVLVYQQSQDVAGLKRLAIAGWKNYLGFNSHKVNNVASYVGMPSDYSWESNADIPYTGTTVTTQIDTLATKLGISQEPGTFDPLYPRFQEIEDDVKASGTGLLDKMTDADNRITNLEDTIGGGATPTPGSLSSRVSALEDTVGSSSSGLVKDVIDINTEIGDDTIADSIKGRIKLNEDNIAANTTDIGNLQTTVGDSSSGLVKDVSSLQSVVGDDNSGLVKEVHDLESKVYQYKGNIIDVTGTNPTTSINVDGFPLAVDVDTLKNGWVFNIDPSDPTVEFLTINNEKFNRGENVAIVNNGTTIKFDKLGTNIDVQKVNELDTRVTKLESYFETITVDSSWTSANILSGIYQCSSICTTSSIPMLSTFVISFGDNGIVNTNNQKIDISSNFTDYWEIDNDLLKPKNLTGTRKLSIHKIGEV